MLFRSFTNFSYWLASPTISTGTGAAGFGVRCVTNRSVNYFNMFHAYGAYSQYYGIRPVVNLDSKVQLKDSGTQKDGCNLYEIIT